MLVYLKDNEVVAWNKIINFDDAKEFINNSSCVWTDKDFDFNNIPQEENKEAKVYYENGDFVVKYFDIPELEPSQLDRIEENTKSLLLSNSALDVLLGVSE